MCKYSKRLIVGVLIKDLGLFGCQKQILRSIMRLHQIGLEYHGKPEERKKAQNIRHGGQYDA